MTITEQKAAQRKAGIAARRALSDTERTRSNAALCARIMALDCFKKAENILLYAAFGGEADLSALAVEAARQGKTLAYPVCGEGFSLTAAVVALAGQALGVLVGDDAAHGGHDGGRDDVLAGDELDIVPLAGQLTVHGRSQLRVGLFHEANGIHHIVVHTIYPSL